VATIERLFGLHLTVRSPTAPINAALNWLLDKIYLQKEKIHIKVKDVASGTDLTGLPFIQSRHDMLITGAALFLATIFGREGDTDVLAIYKWLSEQGIKSGGQWIDEASSHNIFRAMVVHPVFAKDRATELTVHYLSEFQTDSGDWGNRSLFYQTLNALAHLNFPGADMQLEKAFKR
jgi:hypothetical protein